jgi:hypothetical protein
MVLLQFFECLGTLLTGMEVCYEVLLPLGIELIIKVHGKHLYFWTFHD